MISAFMYLHPVSPAEAIPTSIQVQLCPAAVPDFFFKFSLNLRYLPRKNYFTDNSLNLSDITMPFSQG